jgi:hypothetical protein
LVTLEERYMKLLKLSTSNPIIFSIDPVAAVLKLIRRKILVQIPCQSPHARPATSWAMRLRVGSLLSIALGLADSSLTLHGVVTEQLASLLLDACRAHNPIKIWTVHAKAQITIITIL